MCGNIPDMKVTKEKLYMLSYPLELVLNKKWNFRIFSIFEIWEIWLKFSLNILHIRAFFSIFFHIEIGKRFPQNGKNS
jgi:hypothetical protein